MGPVDAVLDAGPVGGRAGLIDRVVAIEAARAALDAESVLALAELGGLDGADEFEWVRDEIACALRIAPATATGRLHDALDLVGTLPLTVSLLADATISYAQARIVLEHTRALPGAVRSRVEAQVLRYAAGRTAAQFRRLVRRTVARMDPRADAEAHQDEMQRRRVVFTPQDHGMTEMWALLPADRAARLSARLSSLARAGRGAGDGRTADQRRADALGDLGDGVGGLDDRAGLGNGVGVGVGVGVGASSGGAPAAGNTVVQVTVGLTTLMGLDDQPGELAGHGPVPAAMARQIAADSHGFWRRLVTDVSGRVVDASRTYRPPTALRETIIARDRTCCFPGCSRAARRCEIDHVRAWADGGRTDPDNLHALCPRHHHLKHDGPGWTVHRTARGITRWRAPTGHHYDVDPDPDDQAFEDTIFADVDPDPEPTEPPDPTDDPPPPF